jgi:uncharacterized membrane protein YdbT with pleckstrin-like domain
MPADPVIARLRPHGRALVGPVLLLVVDAGAATFFALVAPLEWMSSAVIAAGLLVAVTVALPPMLGWLNRDITLTDDRLILRWGVVSRHRQEVLLAHCRGVTVRRSPLQLLAGSGDVLLDTGGERPIVLADVPRPRLVQAAVNELALRQNGRL